jgi:hypothetical protein
MRSIDHLSGKTREAMQTLFPLTGGIARHCFRCRRLPKTMTRLALRGDSGMAVATSEA